MITPYRSPTTDEDPAAVVITALGLLSMFGFGESVFEDCGGRGGSKSNWTFTSLSKTGGVSGWSSLFSTNGDCVLTCLVLIGVLSFLRFLPPFG